MAERDGGPEERYRTLFEGSPVGLYRTTPEGRLVDLNPALADMLGYESRAELLATASQEIYVDPEDRDRWLERLDRDDLVRDFEVELRRRDGSTIWARNTARAVRDGQGRLTHAEGMLQDITEQRQALDALLDSEERWRRLVEYCPVAIAVHTAGTVRYVNPAALRLIGADRPEQIVGRTMIDFVHPDYRQIVMERARQMYGDGTTPAAPLEEKFLRLDGDAVDVEVTAIPIRYKGQPASLTVVHDITERTRAVAEAEHAAEVSQAIADASHAFLESGDVRVLAQRVVDHAVKITNCALGVIVLHDEGRPPRLLAVSATVLSDGAGFEQYAQAREQLAEQGEVPLPAGDNLITAVIRDNTTLIANQPQDHPDWGGRMGEAHPHLDSFLGVPLRAGERVIGMFGLANRPGGFQRRHAKDAETCAHTASLALRAIHAEEERAAFEEQLRQAQKMEAIGQLAGGVAHDFNNLLQVILGHADFVARELEPTSDHRHSVRVIGETAERAAALTQQLMAFSRRQVTRPVDLDLNRLLDNLLRMLRRVIGEGTELTVTRGRDVPTVHADPGQVELIVMNLVVNARDAVSEGGRITIATGVVDLDGRFCETHPGTRPGRHARITVSDDGAGISATVLPRIFDPFFTTKAVGRGTGLGLSTVYGIMMQHRGAVDVESTLGEGSTFHIYFPAVDGAPEPDSDQGPVPSSGGRETILFAEDEDSIRELTTDVLRRAGYTVLEARDGQHALELFEQRAQDIDLVLLDVVMPRIGGIAVVRRVRTLVPEMRVLLISGHPADEWHSDPSLAEDVPLLHKPFRSDLLLKRVRDVLDA